MLTSASEYDLISFGHCTFDNFDAVMAASAQLSADTIITVDADHSLTLTNVNLSSLQHDAFAST